MGQLNQSSIADQIVEHMPCKCGGTKWLMLLEPADSRLLCVEQMHEKAVADLADHGVRTYECPRCQQTEALVVRFK